MAANHPTLSPKATFQVPGSEDTPSSLLDRWSNTYISLPAAVAVPQTENDLSILVAYAKKHGLTIVAVAGKHLASVTITSKTLYVNMKSFDTIHIDEAVRTVTFGGGVTTGPLLDALSEAGYYTSLPNTNSVGMVGAFLGGGSSSLNSVSGFMIDQAIAARVVTAEGKSLILGHDSKGEEAALWNALRGAGHGLGIISSLTLRIHPIADLHLNDGKYWDRTLIFPGPAIGIATATFARLQPVRGPIALKLLLMRSPPGTPAPGSPIAVLTAAYFGPSAEAEKALMPLLDPEVEDAAVQAAISSLPVAAMNDATKMTETRGGMKRSEATLLAQPVGAGTIQRSYERFLKLGDDCPDARFGAVVYFAFDSRMLGAAPDTGALFEGRKTSCILYHDIWFTEEASEQAVDAYLPQAIAIAGEGESAPLRRFANFFRHPAILEETYSAERIAEKKRVKGVWDAENVFWTPGLQ